MATEIYNEGRVVGLSAYEIYVKQFLLENPDGQPASEKEWLASSIASGASIILKVPADATAPLENYHIVEVSLPANTSLCAANTIIGTWLNIYTNETNGVVTDVAFYSRYLIPNDSSTHPNAGIVSNPTNLPYEDVHNDLVFENIALGDYTKIIDGVVLQGGTWEETGRSSPYMKFSSPTFTNPPLVRLLVKGQLINDVYILLTGFTNNAVITGETGTASSYNTPHPENGDYLGPATYPWANKIVFVLNSTMVYYLTEKAGTTKANVPIFEANKYYVKDTATPPNYTVLTTEPANWDAITSPSYNDCYIQVSPNVYKKVIPAADYFNSAKYIDWFGAKLPLLVSTQFSADPSTSLGTGDGYINWAELFYGLSQDKKIQIVSDILQSLSSNLALNSTNNDFELNTGYGIKLGKNYISFNDGLRLYVSSSEPTGTIPDGSIGIGWSPAS